MTRNEMISGRREAWVGRFGITMIVALVVALPAVVFTRELSYYAYPPLNFEPESTITVIRSSPMGYITLAYVCAVVALVVSHQAMSFARSLSVLRRVILGIAFVLGPPLLMVGTALGSALVLDRGVKGDDAAVMRFAVWVMMWLVPWFAYIYVVRFRMWFAPQRGISVIIYLLGIIFLAGMVYPLALWLGNNDGDGQAILAMLAAMALSILIATGLADLVLWKRKEGAARGNETVAEQV